MPVIVLAAFGTSVPEAQNALENIDASVRETVPLPDVRWAFTSQRVIDKLKLRGQDTLFARAVPIRNLQQIYAQLQREGRTDVVVQPLHMVPGHEYHRVLETPVPTGLRVRYGKPMLADAAKVAEFAEVLSARFGGADEVTILCGHGNDRHGEFNAMLVALDKHLRADYENVFVATVEGQPGTEAAFADARKSGKKKVKFVPIMVVAGDHIMNDVMGDKGESWKHVLGLPAACDGGLGCNDAVVDLFIRRLRAALAE